MGSVLEVDQVEKHFRVGFWLKRTKILHKVSLSVPERSIFGFLGANGAGKTTLIHLITGLRKPSAGRVSIFGKDASSIDARRRIGYLPERPYFYSHLTGEGVLRYFGTLAGMERSKIRSRIPEVLDLVGLKEARHLELSRYSKGMLQRIGIAQALIHSPDLLVLDEPMSGLDPLGRKEIRELIVRLASDGRTIFFSSHVIPDVEAICDQIGVIQKGKLLGCGPIGQFLAQGELQTEIAFTGLNIDRPKEWPDFLSLRDMSNGLRGLVSGQEATDRTLRQLLKAKATILWVTPIRPSLESLFGVEDAKTK